MQFFAWLNYRSFNFCQKRDKKVKASVKAKDRSYWEDIKSIKKSAVSFFADETPSMHFQIQRSVFQTLHIFPLHSIKTPHNEFSTDSFLSCLILKPTAR